MYRFAHPITFGDYPQSLKAVVKERLPRFTEAQSKLLKGSIDFLSINYYTSNYAENAPSANGVNVTYVTDRATTLTSKQIIIIIIIIIISFSFSLPFQDYNTFFFAPQLKKMGFLSVQRYIFFYLSVHSRICVIFFFMLLVCYFYLMNMVQIVL